jgi:hypothetical protein
LIGAVDVETEGSSVSGLWSVDGDTTSSSAGEKSDEFSDVASPFVKNASSKGKKMGGQGVSRVFILKGEYI